MLSPFISSLYTQPCADISHKVLYVCDDALGCQTAAVAELVGCKLRSVDHIEVYRSDRTVRKHAVGRRHIAGRDRVQHCRHADDGRRLAHVGADRVLSLVSMLEYLRQRTVVADRTVEHKRHLVLDTVVDDAAADASDNDNQPDGPVPDEREEGAR